MSSIHVSASGFFKQIDLQEDIHGVTNKFHHITLAEAKKAQVLNDFCATKGDIQHQIQHQKKGYSTSSTVILVSCYTASKIQKK